MGNSCKKGEPFDPGAVLDKVIASPTAAEEYEMYKLANFRKGGALIDCFNKGGSKEVERYMRDHLEGLMYNHGRGEFITRTEFLRWRFRDSEKPPEKKKPTPKKHDPLHLWEDHEACWKMVYRGTMGESLLHVLIICDTLVHTRVARILLKVFPKCAVDKIEGEEYLGATGLHLAIAYGNDELAQAIIDCGVNIHTRAIGTFFLPRDQAHDKPKKETNYEGLAYLGEYHLAWAACLANETIYNVLLEKGADPDAQDSFGNTVLHMVVVTNRMGMFGYALRHPLKSGNAEMVNDAGLTCLTLSCKLGRDDLFREMLELSCTEFWRYSNICCSAYPLGALDSIRPSGETNWGSAMMIILAGTKEEHLNMLEGGIIAKLLEEKWKTFALMCFIKKFAILWIHLICISMSVYTRPEGRGGTLLDGIKPGTGEPENEVIFRYCFEIGTILGCLEFLIVQQGEEIKNAGLDSFYRNLKGTPAKLIYLIGNLLILACVPCRILQYRDEYEDPYRSLEETLLIIALPCMWFYLMFFAGAIKLTGPFVTMVFSMITGDMFTFAIIYVIILFGFSQAFHYMVRDIKDAGPYKTYMSTWVGLFHMTLGEYDYGRFDRSSFSGFAKLFFILFQVMLPILLLNMLIAMMGNTFAMVNEKSEKEFLKQWAKVIMSMERSISPGKAKEYLEAYSIRLGENLRGVMVIKSKDKTRARQRKGAVSNWKKTGKTVIRYLKRRKMTGDDLRREMWVHDEAATPKAARKKKGKGYDVTPGLPGAPGGPATPTPGAGPMGGALVPVGPGGVSMGGGVSPPVLPNLPPEQQEAARRNAMNGNGALNPLQSLQAGQAGRPLTLEQQFLLNHLQLLQQYEMLHQMHRARTMQANGAANAANGTAAASQGSANAMDQATAAAADPAQDTIFGPHGHQPAFIGQDPHFLPGGKRRRTREEFMRELFLRKRGKKSIRNFRLESLDVAALMDDDDMADSSEDEAAHDDASRNSSDIRMDKQPKGSVNKGFVSDEVFRVENEKGGKPEVVVKSTSKDTSVEATASVHLPPINETGEQHKAANGNAVALANGGAAVAMANGSAVKADGAGENDEGEGKKDKKKKKEKKEKKEKKKKKEKDKEEEDKEEKTE